MTTMTNQIQQLRNQYEKAREGQKGAQDLLARLEEESKGEKIREASYFQQRAVLQVNYALHRNSISNDNK